MPYGQNENNENFTLFGLKKKYEKTRNARKKNSQACRENARYHSKRWELSKEA